MAASADSPSPTINSDVDAEKWLEMSSHQVIKARIKGLESLDAVQAFVSYEVRHEDRKGILNLLQAQAEALREKDD